VIGGNTNYCPSIGCGTVFRTTRQGTINDVYFTPEVGLYPRSGLLLATDGNYYGITSDGGSNMNGCYNGSCGTIFLVSPGGKLTNLYSFCALPDCADGFYPFGALTEGTDGQLYGTTSQGGSAGGGGTIFKLTTAGALTTLYSFPCQNGCPEGSQPESQLIQSNDGYFYGTTEFGGNFGCPDFGCGTIFRISPKGILTTLHRFNGEDGWDIGGLSQSPDGTLYGTSFLGGDLSCDKPYGCGLLFSINALEGFNVLHIFEATDGIGPFGTLTIATDGNIYGTTSGLKNPGVYNDGTIFRITPSGELTTLHGFNGSDGFDPAGGLFQGTDGKFYGTTADGGNFSCSQGEGQGCGSIFSLDVGLTPFVIFVQRSARVNQVAGILGRGFTGTTSVSFNGTAASFMVASNTFIKATVPPGATTGYVTVTTPGGKLTSNVPFHVLP